MRDDVNDFADSSDGAKAIHRLLDRMCPDAPVDVEAILVASYLQAD